MIYRVVSGIKRTETGREVNDIAVMQDEKVVGRLVISPFRLFTVAPVHKEYEIIVSPSRDDIEKIKDVVATTFPAVDLKGILKDQKYEYGGDADQFFLFSPFGCDDAKRLFDAIADIADGVFGQTKDEWLTQAKNYVDKDHTPPNGECTIS